MQPKLAWLIVTVLSVCPPLFRTADARAAGIRLSIEPAQVSAAPGATVELQLWARSDSPQAFDRVEVELAWHPGLISLKGHSDEANAYAWSSSGFPQDAPLNDRWSDGNALYQCLSPLGGALPQTDLMLTKLRYLVGATPGSTAVNVGSDTLVSGPGGSLLSGTSGCTVTISTAATGGGTDGGGNGGGGTEGGGAGNTDPGDEPDSPVTDGETTPGDENGTGTEPPDGGEPIDGDQNPGETNSDSPPQDETTSPPGVRPFICGAGVAESLLFSAVGMLAFSWSVRRPRALRDGDCSQVAWSKSEPSGVECDVALLQRRHL